MINGKLGKRPYEDRPALKFADHLINVPAHPIADLVSLDNYPMDMNDQWGCCVVAGADHALQTINTLLAGSYTNWTEQQILTYYKTQNPDFDPATDANDNGMSVQGFLSYLQHHGVILGFAKVDVNNEEEVKAATYLGLGLMVGQVLTQSQQSQDVWDYVPNDPELGGHCTTWVGYRGSPDNEQCVTWGSVVDVTQSFIQNQVDECWFVLTQAHVDHPSFRDNYNLESFGQAFTQITGRPFPVVIPTPTPLPTPPEPAVLTPDQTFAIEAHSWISHHHTIPMNSHFATAVRDWLNAKGL